MKTILTDIEGTTSSISFVRDVLFPYSRQALPGFVAEHGRDAEVRRWLDQVALEHGGVCDDRMIVEILQGMIDADRKHTALKALQGMIWKAGYADGAYAAHVYADAPTALRAWHAAGHPLYVYSSGSVAAQKMFFRHSAAGDLSSLFSGHFDTEIGGKRDADSYWRIAAAIDRAPQDILFLSDVVAELDAARDAGVGTVLVDRREDYPTPRTGEAANGHRRVTSFAAIAPRRLMRDLARLLRDGLRLSLGLAPRTTPLRVGAGHWLLLVALGVLIDVATQWVLVDAPRALNGYGVQTACTGALRLAAAALLCAATQRRALLWPVAGWLEVASWLPGLLLVELARVGAANPYATLLVSWSVQTAWTLVVCLRLALFLDRRVLRAVGAALLACAIVLAPWLLLGTERVWRPDWEAMQAEEDETWSEPGTIGAAEATFYAQPRRLRAALDALAPQRPRHIDLYALAFGGDASEDVFRNEVEFVERLFAQRFDAQGRTLALLNHPASVATRPLATATNLERALRGVGARIDRDEDIVFVYLTSHGSKSHELHVNQPPLPLDPMTPQRLRGALDAAGIRWRVVVVSACYSGGFIDALRDEHTLVLTAARSDRTSFGCGADSDITWFGKAFLAEALNETTDFVAAFEQARASIAAWERDNPDVEASDPQIDAGAKIGAQLDAWRAGFTPGPAVKFEVPAEAEPEAP